jgi:hypothetical protein
LEAENQTHNLLQTIQISYYKIKPSGLSIELEFMDEGKLFLHLKQNKILSPVLYIRNSTF